MKFLLLLSLLLCAVPQPQAREPPKPSYKIIMFSVFGSKSHLNMFYAVGEALSDAGHQVTLISPFPPRKTKKIKEIHMTSELFDTMQKDQKKLAKVFLGNLDRNSTGQTMGPWKMLLTELPLFCRHVIQHEEIAKIIQGGSNQYDIAINNAFSNECTFPIAVHVAKYLVQLSSAGMASLMAHELNVPFPYATTPSIMLGYTSNMNFKERTINSVANFGFYAMCRFIAYPILDSIYDELYPELTKISEAKSKTSLLLVNRISATDGSIPTLPYVQEIGGINNVPAKELPKDLKAFVEGSGDAGFIYVALGSAVPEELMPEEYKLLFIETFSKLPQRVIWKFKEQRKDLPPNVKTVDWAPQQDILGHPKCKAFISHCGHLSLDESMYHGVPVIGMPLFGDQPANIAHASLLGWAIEQQWRDVTVDSLVEKVKEITTNPKYKKQTELLSKRMKDQPQTAQERSVYWIEYVARHGGAMHLRTAADNLNFAQYFLLDVIAAALLALFVTFYIVYKVLCFVFCKLCCGNGKKKEDAKNLKAKKNK